MEPCLGPHHRTEPVSCTEGMSLAHFRMLVHKLLNEDPEMVPKEAPLIVLDSKSAMCIAKNGKDTKHTRHIARIMHFVRNGEKCNMHKNFIGVKEVCSWQTLVLRM